jgi:hypothetical protein
MHASNDEQPQSPSPASKGTARRRLLIGSAPFVLTLAGRPALGAVCTGSAAASFDLNQSSGNPVAGLNCAVSPTCWTARARNEGGSAWLGTNYTPTDVFSQVFAGAGLETSGNNSWRVNPGSATLADALGGFLAISFVRNPNTVIMTNGPLFAAEAVAALLNASFDQTYPNGFTLSVAQVIQSVTQLWAIDATGSPGDDQAELQAHLATRITSYVTARGNGEPCDV